jgi:polyribonucleotide nucleotidyltransferase
MLDKPRHNDDARRLSVQEKRRTHGGSRNHSSPKPSSTTAVRHPHRPVRDRPLAKQAGGAVAAYLDEDTMLLSTTTAGPHPREGFDFFPLTVDVEERMYAAGKIPGSFFRREGRPSTEAILTCRLIDRPLRPSFVKGLRNEVQVVITVLALNPDVQYDVLAINAASASTQISGLPFSGPIGGVRVSLIDGQWVAFPNFSDIERSTFDMVVAGRVAGDDVAIMMVEAEATEHTWDLVKTRARPPPPRRSWPRASRPPRAFIKVLCEAQAELAAKAAKPVEEFPIFLDYQDDVYAAVEAAAASTAAAALRSPASGARGAHRRASRTRLKADLARWPSSRVARRRSRPPTARCRRSSSASASSRDKVRIDGRGLADIRALSAEVEVLPRVHGSAIFERGETQIMGVTTLNMLRMEQQLDTLSPVTRKRYMHNYNFPPYSTGETGRVGSPKRREIGHGALAERALMPVLPTREEFPYAIRQVSEALGSNGSTSMGSVCASTLSLLNAGVPLRAPVAGIAMGLISAEVDGRCRTPR